MRLRKWVKSLLYLIVIISVLALSSDCDNTLTFFIVHVVSAITLMLSATVLIRFN